MQIAGYSLARIGLIAAVFVAILLALPIRQNHWNSRVLNGVVLVLAVLALVGLGDWIVTLLVHR